MSNKHTICYVAEKGADGVTRMVMHQYVVEDHLADGLDDYSRTLPPALTPGPSPAGEGKKKDPKRGKIAWR